MMQDLALNSTEIRQGSGGGGRRSGQQRGKKG